MPSQRKLGSEQFAANLRELRKAANLTQEDLAARAKAHPTQISRLERGTRNPGLDMIVRVRRGLDVPLSELLEGVG